MTPEQFNRLSFNQSFFNFAINEFKLKAQWEKLQHIFPNYYYTHGWEANRILNFIDYELLYWDYSKWPYFIRDAFQEVEPDQERVLVVILPVTGLLYRFYLSHEDEKKLLDTNSLDTLIEAILIENCLEVDPKQLRSIIETYSNWDDGRKFNPNMEDVFEAVDEILGGEDKY